MLVLSFGVIVSHYSTVGFVFGILCTAFVTYLIARRNIQAAQCGVVLTLSILFFAFYSHWVSSGWILVDSGNVINNVMAGVVQNTSASADSNFLISQPGTIGSIKTFISRLNLNWLQIVTTLGLSLGVYRMVRKIDNPLYKGLTVACFAVLLAGLFIPSIPAAVNYSRYYHYALIILAPAFVFTFYNHQKVIMPLLVIMFLVTSGLVFKAVGFDSIDKINIPYSIALENKRLDAGNYLTQDDRAVAKWVSENGIDNVYGDLGGALALQDYTDIFHAHQLDDSIPDGYIFLRTWNTEHQTLSRWVGPGMRRQIPIPEFNREVIFQSGNSILLGAK